MVELRRLHSGEPRDVAGYRLLGGLGDGGQGSVFLGRDASGGHVAVKLLHARLLDDERARRRFLQESATAAKVAGFCTAKVLDSGLVEGRPYIVSEFIDGPSLHDQVLSSGPLSGGELERLAVGTITALTAIHGAGIVHRDFKPSNILMGPDGPRVIDFGIAKAMDASTTAGSVVGTPGYMAPEQISGESATAATDVFSWASTMGFAATGEPIFGRDSIPAVMHRILHAEPDLTRLPGPLRTVLASCLTKDPANRPSADDVLMRLLGRPGDDAGPASVAVARSHGDDSTSVLDPIHDADPASALDGQERRRRLTMIGVGALVATGMIAGIMWRGSGLTGSGSGPATGAAASADGSFGAVLGPAFGPQAGAHVSAMAVGHDRGSPRVAYADATKRSITVWDPRTGRLLDTLPDPGGAPVRWMGLATLGGRQTVLWTGGDGLLRRWRVGDPKEGAWLLVCRDDARMALGRWRDQPAAVIACPDGQVKTYDLVSKEIVGKPQQVRGPITALAWDERSGRPLIGTGAGLLTGSPEAIGEGKVRSVSALGDGLAAITVGASTGVYDLTTHERVRGFTTGTAAVGVTAAGGQRMIATGADGVTVWNADRGDRLGRLMDAGVKVSALAMGDGLLAAGIGGKLRVWSLVSRR
ncbi:serine/threonine-protein kinase [Nonomuraea sp. NPDC050643]|uniref:WD40 repeat domain-containing serine/threonine protein kinase n=1 Tax=Nonomuraea sp. NPDC050643 TaxID=3155660 RepID=UPI0033D3D1A7